MKRRDPKPATNSAFSTPPAAAQVLVAYDFSVPEELAAVVPCDPSIPEAASAEGCALLRLSIRCAQFSHRRELITSNPFVRILQPRVFNLPPESVQPIFFPGHKAQSAHWCLRSLSAESWEIYTCNPCRFRISRSPVCAGRVRLRFALFPAAVAGRC